MALIRARSFKEMWQVQASLTRQNLQSFLGHCARLTDIATRVTLHLFETFREVSAEHARS